MLEGSVEVVPAALFDQLKDGGRLVGMLGRGAGGKIKTPYAHKPHKVREGGPAATWR